MISLANKTTAQLMSVHEITEELYNRFINFIDAKPKTVETYKRALRQFFRFLSLRAIKQPTREDVIAFREELRNGHKSATIQSYIVAVRLFFKWTEQEGIYKNVADMIKGVAISKEYKKDYLTPQQVKTILARIDKKTLSGRRDYSLLAIMLTGGLRTIEASRANIEDLRTIGDTTALFIQGKGREEKTDFVKIPSQVETALRGYLKLRRDAPSSAPLFASTSNNSQGQRLTTRSISAIVKQRFKNAGFNSKRLTAHSLRHTAVTLSLLGGQGIQEVQQFARHSSITTTQLYAHNLDRMKNQCEATIAQAIF
jgi:integrase/recombinase XerC